MHFYVNLKINFSDRKTIILGKPQNMKSGPIHKILVLVTSAQMTSLTCYIHVTPKCILWQTACEDPDDLFDLILYVPSTLGGNVHRILLQNEPMFTLN